jgi:hypothetical protein
MKIWDKYYECSCHAQIIMAHYDEEDGIKLVDLAFFSNYIDGRMTLWQRLRFAWQVLRTGTPWADMVVLDTEEAKRLGEDLISFVDKGIIE